MCHSKPAKMVMIQRSCSYENLRYLHPHQQPKQVYIHLLLHRGGSLLIITNNTTHSFCFFSFLNKDAYSNVGWFLADTTLMLLT